MRTLILIRHSQSKVVPEIPASRWSLTEEGRRRCALLAAALTPHDLKVIITSKEPKAWETGRLTANHLGVPVNNADDLHEHDRTGAPFTNQAQFVADVEAFFARPGDQVFGNETANEALARFTRAVEDVVDGYPAGNLAIVTHGTVLSLFVAARSGREPFPFWQQLDQPAYVTFTLPDYTLSETAFSVTAER